MGLGVPRDSRVSQSFAWIINNTLLIKQCYDNAKHLIMLNLQLS
jgi:hypothetical protein